MISLIFKSEISIGTGLVMAFTKIEIEVTLVSTAAQIGGFSTTSNGGDDPTATGIINVALVLETKLRSKKKKMFFFYEGGEEATTLFSLSLSLSHWTNALSHTLTHTRT